MKITYSGQKPHIKKKKKKIDDADTSQPFKLSLTI